jgi:O-acetylserine/cysteine efflux transporter
MLCTVALWGFNIVTMRVALEVFTPVQMTFARSAITLLILLPWWKPFRRIPWQLMASALAIGVGSFYLFYEAIRITDSLTTVAVTTQMMPPFSAILAFVIFREPISSRKWLGIAIATIGAVYLASASASSLSLKALGLTIGAVLFYSVGSIVIGKSKTVGVWRMLAWISALSLLPLGLAAAVSGPLYPDLSQLHTHHWLALLFTIVVAGLFGQAVLFNLYRKYPVADVAPWALLIPVFAGVSSILVYDESISISLFLGGVIILFGVWIQQHSGGRDRGTIPTL